MENVQGFAAKAIEMVMVYAPKVVLAIVTLFIGLWFIKMIVRSLVKIL